MVNTSLSAKAQEALGHYNKANEYLKQNNWAMYGKELQEMKNVLIEMSTDTTTSSKKTQPQMK